jgi:uncharacterized membrane protein YdjX (TVP38/TMEM64 family)
MSRFWGWSAVLGLCAMVYWWQPEFFATAYHFIERGDIAGLAAFLRSFGGWSIGITLLLFVVMTFTIVFPFMILSGAAAIMYGIFGAVLISWLGEVLGALVMFFFARVCFRNLVAKWIGGSPYWKQVDDYSAENGFKALLIARLLPLAPSGIITAVAAISRISFRDFFLATLLGKFPPVVFKVLIGHDLVYASENMTRLISVVAVVILIYLWLWWRKRKKRLAIEAGKRGCDGE